MFCYSINCYFAYSLMFVIVSFVLYASCIAIMKQDAYRLA